MKQFGANMRLKESDRAADGCRRSAEAPARTSKTPLGDGRHKDFHRVDAVHFFFRLEQHWLRARQADRVVHWSSRASASTMPRRSAFATANYRSTVLAYFGFPEISLANGPKSVH